MKQRDLLEHYKENRDEINSRLEEFQALRTASDERLFKELTFVILTSQSSAKNSWNAANRLDKEELLTDPERTEIENILELNDIRFEERKSQYITENFSFLSQPTFSDSSTDLKIQSRIKPNNLDKTRKWVVENIKGVSWKGASHFLRNIGFGNDFAILSEHSLSVLSDLGAINSVTPPSTRKEYLETEKQVQDFSKEIGMEIQALDLTVWSYRTDEVFK